MTLDQILSFNYFLEHEKIGVRDSQSGETDESITGGGFGFSINFPKTPEHSGASLAISYALPLTGPKPSESSSGIVYVNGMFNFFSPF